MDSDTHTAVSRVDMTNIPEELVFGLDIGTRSIVGTVGYKSSANSFVVVAQTSVAHETRSMLDGQIHDIGKVAGTIRTVCDRLEHITGREFTEVCIAAAGRVLKTVEAEADIHFNTENVVTGEQIYSLDMLGVEKAYDILRSELKAEDVKFYCVGYSVKQYYQNSYPISNLEGHKCSSIKVELIATFLPDEVVDGLYAAVERAGLYVANLTLEPIAAINVAIPERFRLLNLALVDVGAGTSDISITRDGSIVAYGMIPFAGDEVTEAVAKYYLTDFTEADRMKCASTTDEEVTYHDIMGLPQKIPSQDLVAAVEETVRNITKNVSDKIIELNGGKSVSAVFVVGGGGKIGGFVETLAEYQGLQPTRVALRGAEVLTNVKFLQEDITVDSLLVTPVGICMNYYEQKNNFIFVTVNGERTKLYDNNKLTIMDAAMQIGFPNEDLFPKRGNTITYYLSGEKRMHRGEPGEAAVIRINGRETGINSPIESNDRIEITPSTRGRDAELTVGKIAELKSNLVFYFNGKKITCSRFVSVNGELVSEFYDVKDGDRIELLDYYTLKQVLEFMDIIEHKQVTVNNIPAGLETKVYDNFTVLCDMKEQVPYDFAQLDPTGMSVKGFGSEDEEQEDDFKEGQDNRQAEEESSAAEDSAKNQLSAPDGADGREAGTENQPSASEKEAMGDDAENQVSASDGIEASKEAVGDSSQSPPSASDGEAVPETVGGGSTENLSSVRDKGNTIKIEEADAGKQPASTDVFITVNGEPVILKGKESYILVDVLDFYPVDTSVAHGDHLETKINGIDSDFSKPLKPNDQVTIQWVG